MTCDKILGGIHITFKSPEALIESFFIDSITYLKDFRYNNTHF